MRAALQSCNDLIRCASISNDHLSLGALFLHRLWILVLALEQHVSTGLKLRRLVCGADFAPLLILARHRFLLPRRVMHVQGGENALCHRAEIGRVLASCLDLRCVGVCSLCRVLRTDQLVTDLG